MIRPAKFVDIPRMVDLLCTAHAESKYAARMGVSRKAAHTLLQQAVQRHGGQHEGGTLVMVAEKGGEVEGLMVGTLNRVYFIGDKLEAQDVFLFVTPQADKRDASRLLDAYLEWADGNPKVDFEDVKLSHTDALPGAERVAKLYAKKGFRRCGAIYERGQG